MIPHLGSCEGHRPSAEGEPVWDLATFFPAQGCWTDEDYLALSSNRLIEITDGWIEVLPMPTILHQLIVEFLHAQLKRHVGRQDPRGLVLFAPLPVRLRPGMYREPDVVYVSGSRAAESDLYPVGADLVMEVVSEVEQNRQRDYVRKRHEYCEGGVSEYWIVDPQQKTITVLVLANGEYEQWGVFAGTDQATSRLFPGFQLRADEVFSVATRRGPDHEA